MRSLTLGLLAALLGLGLWLWGFGGADQVSRWAAATQRDVQNAMAAAIRALRAQEPGALAALWGLCAAYGFVHAAGPGHGKLVIGGYGVAERVAARRLAGLALASSLAQAASAVILVYAAIFMLGWGRAQMTTAADRVMAPLSYSLIAGIGAWLMLRGLRKALRQRRKTPETATAPTVCSDCGHVHAPSPAQAAQTRSLRDALAVIGSIAIRPCTGAIFLLILTHALGLDWAGIVGTFVMGAGTAAFTVIVAIAAVGLRESALAQVASGPGTARLMAAVEMLAGGVVILLAGQLLLRSL